MAIRFDNTTERLLRTANVPDDRAFTLCGWFQRVSHAGVFAALYGLSNTTSSPNRAIECGWDSAGSLYVTTYDGGANTFFATNYTNGQWFFGALTGGASVLNAYAGGPSVGVLEQITATFPIAYTPGALWVGDNGWGESANFRAAAIKGWDTALTAAELGNERWYYTPQRRANLNLWTPLFAHTDVQDHSGNARNWTTTGTLSTEDGPPIAWSPRARRYFLATGGGLNLVRTASESVQVAEATARAATLNRLAAEQVSVANSATLAQGIVRQFAEAEALAEASLRTLALLRSHAETVQSTEATSPMRGLLQLLAETVTLIESSAFALGRSQIVNETLAMAESTARVLGQVLAIAESLNLSAATHRVLGKVLAVADTLSLSELTAQARLLARSITEALNVVETLAPSRALARLIAESHSLLESVPTARTLARLVIEAVSLLETLAQAIGKVRVVSESLAMAESLARALSQVSATFLFAAITILAKLGGALGLAPKLESPVAVEPQLKGKIEVDP